MCLFVLFTVRVRTPQNPHLNLFCLITALAFLFQPASFVEARESQLSETRRIMGTMVEVTVFSENRSEAEQAIESAFLAVEQVDRLMSSYKEKSDVSHLSQSSGKKAVLVHPLTMHVIERSLYYGELSSGAFDITAGKIKQLYKLGKGGAVPSDAALQAVLQLTGYKKIKILGGNKVFLPVQGMEIDLGGIAKGYAIDASVRALKKSNVRSGMVNAGGDIRVIGKKRGVPWRVGVMDPRKAGALLGTVQLSNMSIATSGDYMQFFEKKGRRYSHIVDPVTGNAIPKSRTVTVLAPLAIDSDALSTTVSVLGPEKGMALIETLPGVEVMIMDVAGNVLFSKGFSFYYTAQ